MNIQHRQMTKNSDYANNPSHQISVYLKSFIFTRISIEFSLIHSRECMWEKREKKP